MPGAVKNQNNRTSQYKYEVEILGDGTSKNGIKLDTAAIVSIKKFDSYGKEVGEQYFNLKSRYDAVPTYTYMNSKVEGISQKSEKEMFGELNAALNQKNVKVSITTLDIANNAAVLDTSKLPSKDQLAIARNFVRSNTEQFQDNIAKTPLNIDFGSMDIKGLSLGAFATNDKLNEKYKTLSSGTDVAPTQIKEKGGFRNVINNLAEFFHRSEKDTSLTADDTYPAEIASKGQGCKQ